MKDATQNARLVADALKSTASAAEASAAVLESVAELCELIAAGYQPTRAEVAQLRQLFNRCAAMLKTDAGALRSAALLAVRAQRITRPRALRARRP